MKAPNLPELVLKYCQDKTLFCNGDKVLVAVSGGADSLVLLDCLLAIKQNLGLELGVGHVDHDLRPESADDAANVKNHAENLGLPVLVTKVNIWEKAPTKATLEQAARAARYEALQQMARQFRATKFATGHSQTDQAETVLMRMIRGTGPLGLGGISPFRKDNVVRPLLSVSRNEIMAWATAKDLPIREDSTNQDTQYLRNRIRAELLPLLKTYNPQIESSLAELAEDFQDLGLWLLSQLPELKQNQDAKVVITKNQIDQCPPALRPYMLAAAFHQASGAPLGLSRPHVLTLVDLATGPSSRQAHLPRRVIAQNVKGDLELFQDLEGPPPGSARRNSGPN